MNSLDILIALAAAGMGFMFMVIGYSIGYRQGHGEGFIRGRAIAQALKEREFYALPADIKISDDTLRSVSKAVK
jgi:hypothetical protein